MAYNRNDIVKQAQAWIGCKEADGSHKKIIDVYNAHKPLARNYKVKYSDNWCATFISACAIKCGATDIIPTECSCGQMIELMKAKGIWEENDDITPNQATSLCTTGIKKTGGRNTSESSKKYQGQQLRLLRGIKTTPSSEELLVSDQLVSEDTVNQIIKVSRLFLLVDLLRTL